MIQFISNNPGYWFLHCHIEPHQMEGMAMVVNIAKERQPPPPPGLSTCGDFTFSLDDFNERLLYNFDNTSAFGGETRYCNCINQTELIIAIVFGTLGFIVFVLLPWIFCVTAGYKLSVRRKKAKSYDMDALSDHDTQPVIS